MPKEFKTIDEQIEIFRSRGLEIPANIEENARSFLLKNNYYRISGYSLTLRDHDVFFPQATFKNIMDIYNFDREFRNVLLWAIELIEVNIKSIYAYLFSKYYGGLGYLDSSHYTDVRKYMSVINHANASIEKRLDQEAYLQHYVKDVKEPIPLWAYVDLFTISDISVFYSISDDIVKREIAKEYGLTHGKASNVMTSYLHGMTIIRNLCAHDSRLFNRLFKTKPNLNKSELGFLNKDTKGNPDNSKLFGYILVIKRLITDEEFGELKEKILVLCKKYPFVEMRYYGFCNDWQDII